MPHQCTHCGRVFSDGSTEMLSGCPNCGGHKFQYLPQRPDENAPTEDSPATDAISESHNADVSQPAEDTAQAEARTTTVDPQDLPDTPTQSGLAGGSDVDSPNASPDSSAPDTASETTDTELSETDMQELRSELNDQFESIKIVSPGEYELNLMELYDREEHIVSLMEDGRYAINVPGRRTGEQ